MSRRCCSIVGGSSGGGEGRGGLVLSGRMGRDRIKAAKLGCRWCTENDLGAESSKRPTRAVRVDCWAGGWAGWTDGRRDRLIDCLLVCKQVVYTGCAISVVAVGDAVSWGGGVVRLCPYCAVLRCEDEWVSRQVG